MAKGVNRVTLLGNVGKQPEIRATNGGTVVATFSLATPERRKDACGDWQEFAEWHNCVAFGRTAEIIRDYVPKGAKLYLEGKLQTRSWDDKESGQKRYKTEILINELTLLGAKSDAHQATRTDGYEPQGRSYEHGADSGITDEDIPF